MRARPRLSSDNRGLYLLLSCQEQSVAKLPKACQCENLGKCSDLRCQWPCQRSHGHQRSLRNTAQRIAKLLWVHLEGAEPGKVVSRTPSASAALLLLAAAVFLVYLAWCDCCVKESYCILCSVIVSWENPTPRCTIYLKIIMKMIFLIAMTIS